MPYANVDDRLHFHPKLSQVGLAGAGLFLKGLSYCACYGTDGFIEDMWVRIQVSQPGEDPSLPDKLVKAGLWHKAKGGYRVHDYLDHNISKAQWDARRAAGRKGATARHAIRTASRTADRSGEPEPEPDPEPRKDTREWA